MEDSMDINELVQRAEHGDMSKGMLADLLAPDARYAFLESCAQIERDFTDQCAAKGDFCLESGCALEGDACLEALLVAGPEYQKACARVWRSIFSDPRNRAEA
jgi:hypothetical protein